jgi:hypothetical protein
MGSNQCKMRTKRTLEHRRDWWQNKTKKKELLDKWKRHLSLIRDLGVFTPKHHLMLHMILRAPFFGNPWSHHTFLDESLNKQLKAVCRLCHQLTFDSTVLIKMCHTMLRHAKRALE